MLTKEELLACPVATTLRLIGIKWKLLLMRNLLAGPRRFYELGKTISGISQKVLMDNLRSMEQDGIITRTVSAKVPPRAEYRLRELCDGGTWELAASDQSSALHVTVQPGQTAAINSTNFSIIAGAAFTATFIARDASSRKEVVISASSFSAPTRKSTGSGFHCARRASHWEP